jgi:glutamate dehydrogenase
MTSPDAVSGTHVDPIITHLSGQLAGDALQQAQAFTREFMQRVPADEMAQRTTAEWSALVQGSLDYMREREVGVAKVRVSNPMIGTGRSRTVIDVVTDDMPFLVDSVGMAIADAGLGIHAVIHPVYRVGRDSNGRLQTLAPAETDKGMVESVMHFEIDRVNDAAELERLHRAVGAALEDVRASVVDWQAMRTRMLELADSLPGKPMPVDAAGVSEAQNFLRWAANDNFTFLGCREYAVSKVGGDEVLQAVDGSGLGILRGSERSLAPRSLRTLVATALPQSGSMDAIILTKTNARSHVHRPGYMDYIGVLGFDETGVPVVEQRFLGLFTTNAYMARPQDVPLVRRKVETVMQRSGLRRESHSGKALRHVLELLPRDELLQASEDELFTAATGILALGERPRTRVFVRRDKYGRF